MIAFQTHSSQKVPIAPSYRTYLGKSRHEWQGKKNISRSEKNTGRHGHLMYMHSNMARGRSNGTNEAVNGEQG